MRPTKYIFSDLVIKIPCWSKIPHLSIDIYTSVPLSPLREKPALSGVEGVGMRGYNV
jgi:hypothetical protein